MRHREAGATAPKEPAHPMKTSTKATPSDVPTEDITNPSPRMLTLFRVMAARAHEMVREQPASDSSAIAARVVAEFSAAIDLSAWHAQLTIMLVNELAKSDTR
jgi:hypothetical protein